MCPRLPYTDLLYTGGTKSCEPIKIIFTSLSKKFGLNRTFHVLKTQYTDLTYMGGTGSCGPMTMIFGSVV